jgi:hypothetical protein
MEGRAALGETLEKPRTVTDRSKAAFPGRNRQCQAAIQAFTADDDKEKSVLIL